MDEYKTCKCCLKSLPITTNFYEGKPRKDGSKTYLLWCSTCKYEYNLEYMRKRRADPDFKAKEKAYLDAYHTGQERPKNIYK
jgi:hypothetical protein